MSEIGLKLCTQTNALHRDMATEASVNWEIEGILSVEFSVSSMLKVIATTTPRDTGKFLTWEGRVSLPIVALGSLTKQPRNIPGSRYM